MTPRTAEQNQALREATRERLLEAALRVFSRLGYDSASIRLIAAEAGLAQGLMYSHFKGKEELLQALFRLSMDQVRESFTAAAPGRGGQAALPPLERLVRTALSIVQRNLDFWRLSYGVRMQAEVMKVLGPDFQAWTREILSVLQAHFRSAGSREPTIDAALFFAAFDGLCQHYVLDPAHYPLEKVASALLARFTPTAAIRAGAAPAAAARPSEPPPKGASHGKPRRR